MSILAALAVAMITWSVRRVAQRLLVVVLAISAVTLAAGAASGLPLYPWTDLPVLGFAVASGILVGRRVPPRPMPMLVLLAVLAGLDAIQIVASGPGVGAAGGADAARYFYTTLVIDTPWSRSGVGIFDVLVIAAMAEHAGRRGLPFVVGAAPGILGFLAADVAVLLDGRLNLPLVPFLLAGWLATGFAVRIVGMPSRSTPKPAAR